MEALEQEQTKERKESRTERLLRQLKVGADFGDPGLPNGYFSHSQYVSWRICGKAYEFRYVLKERSPSNANMARGTTVHAGIEFMLLNKREGKVPSIAEGEQKIVDTFEKTAGDVGDWGEDEEGNPIDPGKVKDTSLELFRTFAIHALPKIQPVGIEEGFAKKFGDVPMIGWIDLVDRQPALKLPDNASPEIIALTPHIDVVVDWKTGRAKWSENELRKDTQMTLYTAVKNTPKARVDQLLAKKKTTEYVRGDTERTPGDIEVLTEDLHEVTDYIKKGIFPKTSIDNWSCNAKHCPYWSKCRGAKNP